MDASASTVGLAIGPAVGPAVPRGRRRRRGQVSLVDAGAAAVVFAVGVGVFATIDARQRRTELAQTLGEQHAVLADAAARYVARHHTAFAQYFAYSPGQPKVLDVAVGCPPGSNRFDCAMPHTGGNGTDTASWRTLSEEQLLPAETTNVNAYGQTYHLLVRCNSSDGTTCDTLSAVLLTAGGRRFDDGMAAVVARKAGYRSGYLPADPAAAGPAVMSPAWLTAYNRWSVYGVPMAQPGHVALTLDYEVGQKVATGALQRASGGDDARANTMGRTLYLGRDSSTLGAANVCFCGDDGEYHNACRKQTAGPNGAVIYEAENVQCGVANRP